ncbi:MAG: leucine--tRNA ligase, partial [Lachnospiraceae bacterium]|nr:leucine--tRNA ligase [Lachnospiraceae bacterium]
YLRITEYADKLLEGLDHVDYPANVKQQQINWIGKSTGAFVDFKVDGVDEKLEIYTTRPDTLFGVTFMVMAPEHPLIDKYADRISNMDAIKAYRSECAKKTEFERTQLVKDKTGVKIEGLEAVNPVNGKKIPIFIADYVMMGYGTGAIMAVPAHDQRDYDFAKAFNIDIIEVIKGGDITKEAYTGDGEMVNSEFLNGYTNKKDSIKKMLEELTKQGIGRAGVQFKMKDWAFNRQRYWGEPIPIVHCDNCGVVPVPYEELPLRLPKVENFEPGVEGESPLAKIDSFVKCKCPKCGRDARRETDTMPQWAGSSWYFLRYIDPHNDKCLADPEKLKYWMPVDWYNGGMEHVTRHVIYSRFWHHFLYDIGVVNTPEPYAKRSIQGLILGPDGDKMSKSKGNVVDPLDIVEDYGADTLRTYVLFMGDYGAATPWNENSVKGCKRFLERVAGFTDMLSEDKETEKLETPLHKTIKKVSSDIEDMKFNTAIAALMTLTNDVYNVGKISKEQLQTFIKLLCPFAPHLCEEMWEATGGEGFLSLASWPTYEEAKTVDAQTEIGVQINGKLRGTVVIPTGADKEEVFAAAKADPRIASLVEGKTFVKEIYVPNRVVNFVVK